MLHFSKSITINRPRLDVYQLWRQLDRLPEFMIHLESVTLTGDRRSHWVAKAPAGRQVEWDAEITDDEAGELIAWRSLEHSDVPNGGSVRFTDAPADRGTELRVDLYYEPVGGKAGSAFAKLFGEEPSLQLRDDLRRFKQVMETGEVVRSDGSLEGAGEGASKERPAQAPKTKVGVRS
jgi:uncharacterized membrane protein